jgi:hypothetical protein
MANVPVFKISLTNASILSGLYLLIGVVVELLRRVWNPRWLEQVSLSLEAFPARTLELFGLFEPLRRAWVEDRISPLGVRFVYGFTTVAVIFLLGLAVGGLMWIISKFVARPASRP